MFKEFKDFLSRGNVIDLAVAVVIGVAFAALVEAIVKGLLAPALAMLGEREYNELDFTIRESTFEYGTVIAALLEFLLIAVAVFFFVVKPMNAWVARRRRGEVEEEELSDEAALLAEIRDLLQQQQQLS